MHQNRKKLCNITNDAIVITLVKVFRFVLVNGSCIGCVFDLTVGIQGQACTSMEVK